MAVIIKLGCKIDQKKVVESAKWTKETLGLWVINRIPKSICECTKPMDIRAPISFHFLYSFLYFQPLQESEIMMGK